LKRSVVILIVILTMVFGSIHMFAAPGDADDPVITLRYIEDEVIPKIKELMQVKQSETTTELTFQVVNVAKGAKLIGEAGTEIILRMGKANIIATAKGGVANVTEGIDLKDGVPSPANSLLIVPLADGRGLDAKTDIIVMVKGKYTIKQ